MSRTLNSTCDTCNKEFYRRPSQTVQSKGGCYCSMQCYSVARILLGQEANRICPVCNSNFHPKRNTQRFCSVICSASRPRSVRVNERLRESSKGIRAALAKNIQLSKCMVVGCNYCKTLDVHRLIPGHEGGKYEIGNMFAVCPNHHAEIHRGITKVEKVNDYTLRELEA